MLGRPLLAMRLVSVLQMISAGACELHVPSNDCKVGQGMSIRQSKVCDEALLINPSAQTANSISLNFMIRSSLVQARMLRTCEERMRREAGTLATILDQISEILSSSGQQNSSFAPERPRNRNQQKLGLHLRRVKLTSTRIIQLQIRGLIAPQSPRC
jgi:hypothetical protein